MTDKTYIPFAQIGERQNIIIVDGQHAQGFVLSHWRGANRHSELLDDTSADIVLNAIKKNCPELQYPYITATHFDIDGFVGVWSLFYPELALKNESILRQIASLGDFRHFNPDAALSLQALQCCCWLNTVEKREFYRPYNSDEELDDCVAKFEYFLPRFAAVLENPSAFEADWQEEYKTVLSGLEALKKANCRRYEQIGLISKSMENPQHYYALFADTAAFDWVLSIYAGNRYELECKYTTWVDLASRPILPRLNLLPLTEQLNAIEKSTARWYCDKMTDTGPILRLEMTHLSKADRYANPTEREIYASSIAADEFESLVVNYLEQAYKNMSPKRFWTWQEMRG